MSSNPRLAEFNRSNKGKTFVDRFGEERAKKISAKVSAAKIGKPNPSPFKGMKLAQIVGKEREKIIREKMRKGMIGRVSKLKGKSHEEFYGKERAEEIRKNIIKAHNTKEYLENAKSAEKFSIDKSFLIEKGTEIFKRLGSILKVELYKEMKSYCTDDTIIRKFGSAENFAKLCNGTFKDRPIYIHTIEDRLKIKEANSKDGNEIIKITVERWNKYGGCRISDWVNYMSDVCSICTIRNKFKGVKNFEKYAGIKFKEPIFGPRQMPGRIGRNEPFILDSIEKEKNIKLDRQLTVSIPTETKNRVYFVDGYDRINNVAYEVDERHHKVGSLPLADKFREFDIREHLKCDFIRIDEEDFMNKIKSEVE